MNSSVRLSLFGHFQLLIDGRPVEGLTSGKTQALLAYLAVSAAVDLDADAGSGSPRPHTREQLAELLWPERPPGQARQNLRQTLSRLQRTLHDHPLAAQHMFLRPTRQVLYFDPSVIQVDVVQFLQGLQQCALHPHTALAHCATCNAQLTNAAALYRGDFLADVQAHSPSFEEWARLKAEWLRREMLQTLETLGHHAERQGNLAQAISHAWRAIEIDSLREEQHRRLMRVLTLTGRRSDALTQYERCRHLLWDELGVPPAPETQALFAAIEGEVNLEGTEYDLRVSGQTPSTVHSTTWPDATGKSPQATARPYRLPPQHTPFVGRSAELERLTALLRTPTCHLITLVGMGGMGKTRLALQVAAEQQADFTHGVCFVQLVHATSLNEMVNALGESCGFAPPAKSLSLAERKEALLHFLQNQELLCILDNFEQLLTPDFQGEQPVDLVTELIHAAPGIQLLVTSRQPLHLRAEWLFDLGGLSYPHADEEPPEGGTQPHLFAPTRAAEVEQVRRYEAVRFLEQSAQRVYAQFALSAENAAAAARVCHMVQGAPLAIELASAWVRELSCEQIARRVAENLDFLATTMRDVPPRHRSLRAVFNSSWALLPPGQQSLLARLSIFRGDFSGEAAAQVADAQSSELAELLARALIRTNSGADRSSTDAALRFEMHPLVHQFAGEKLRQNEHELSLMQQRHAHFYTHKIAAEATALQSSDAAAAVARVRSIMENVRAAWRWAVAQREIVAIERGIHSLLRYYVLTSQSEEGEGLFGQALAAVEAHIQTAPAPEPRAQQLLAELYALRARMNMRMARYADAIADAQAALAISEALQAWLPTALAHLYAGMCLLYQSQYSAAQPHLRRSLQAARTGGLPKQEADALRGLGIWANERGDFETARAYYAHSLHICRQIEDLRGASACLGNMGDIYREEGDYANAREYLMQSLQIHRQLHDRSSEGRTLTSLGELDADLEEYAEAIRHFQQSIAILSALREEQYVADAQKSLGELYLRLGQQEEAVVLWQDALATYTELGEVENVEKVRSYLQHVQRETGTADCVDERRL